ncbi:MAG: chromate transporter, partial [Clostridia bacterium]|nr:chromate transporter [Clostridia bacterium]
MLLKLFLTFFKIGLFTFGGGYAMIANVRESVVEKNGWLSEDEFMEIIAIAESTPGPIAINMATFVGYKKAGVLGSAFATLGVVLPSLVIIFSISLFLDAFMKNKIVAYAFSGIKCAVAFLILKAGFGMFKKLEKKPLPIIVFSLVLALMIFLELISKSVSTVALIALGGIIGIF